MEEVNKDEMIFDKDDIEKNKVFAILAYILFLIPLLAAKDSPFAKYHTNQGLVLFIAVIVSIIALRILGFILDFIPILGWIAQLIIAILFPILILAFVLIGIINAANGKAKPLPVIGNISILK